MATTSETTQDDSPMRLSVTNFGPIAEADIELRPLTVFVGPSNTGKSYLASLIYALHNSFSQIFDIENILAASHNMNGNSSLELTKQEQADFLEWALQTFPSDNLEKNTTAESNDAIPPKIQGILNKSIKNYHSKIIKREIERCFGVSAIDDLVRYNSNKRNSDINIHSNLSETRNSPRGCINIVDSNLEFSTIIPTNLLQVTGISDTILSMFISATNGRANREKIIAEIMIRMITSEIIQSNMKQSFQPVYYLPANRTGAMHARRVVMSSLIRGATTVGNSYKLNNPILSGVLGDFFNELLDMSKASENRDFLSGAAKRIEEEILGGSIHIAGEYEDMPFPEFTYQPDSWKKSLSLMNSSSMVSELAPVVLYLRHKVRPGNILIIEEPESHLHPGKQVELMRQLALLIQEGIRIIITTHSEWILEALTNIVQISELPPPQRENLPSKDFSLEPNQVGVWLFKSKSRSKGFIVEPININNESDAFPADYDKVMDALYNEWAETANRKEELRQS